MPISSRSGTSLLEMLVALVLLELLAVGTMHAVLQTHRIARWVAAGGAVDVARLETVRQAAAARGCRDAAEPTVATINLPAVAQRPAMVVQVACGP